MPENSLIGALSDVIPKPNILSINEQPKQNNKRKIRGKLVIWSHELTRYLNHVRKSQVKILPLNFDDIKSNLRKMDQNHCQLVTFHKVPVRYSVLCKVLVTNMVSEASLLAKVSERQKLILSSFNRLACYWANTYTSRIRVCEATDWRIGLNVRFNVQLNSTRCDNTIDALILLKNESVILQQLIHVTEDVTTVNAHLISAWCCSLWILLICYETAIFVSVYMLAFVNVLAPKTANAGKNVFS